MFDELFNKMNFMVATVDHEIVGEVYMNKNFELVFRYIKFNEEEMTKRDTMYFSDFLKTNNSKTFKIVF